MRASTSRHEIHKKRTFFLSLGRTPGTGLYDNLQKYDLPTPESVFQIDYFKANPSAFYQASGRTQKTRLLPDWTDPPSAAGVTPFLCVGSCC